MTTWILIVIFSQGLASVEFGDEASCRTAKTWVVESRSGVEAECFETSWDGEIA